MTANIKSKIFKGNMCEIGTREEGLLSNHTNPLRKYPIFRCLSCFILISKISNEEVLRRVGEERISMEIIQRRQGTWIGHTLRHGDLLVVMIEGRIEGKRPPGRKRVSMLDPIKDGTPYSHFKRPTMDRML